MRLAIFFADNVLFDGNRYYTRDSRHYEFSEVARHFDSTDFAVFTRRCPEADKLGLDLIDISRMNVIGLPGYCDSRPLLTKSGWEKRLFKLPYLFLVIARLLFQKRADWDVLLIFDPYFTNMFMYLLTKLFKKPAVFYVGSRWDKNLLLNARYQSWDRRFANYLKTIIYRSVIPLIIRHLPTIVTGQEIYSHYYRDGVVMGKIVPTAIRREHIDLELVQTRMVRDGLLKLIIVCRLTLEKSVETLIQAVALLKERKIPVQLTIVGPIGFENYYEFLLDRISDLGVKDLVRFTGEVNNREALLQLYADSDIFVLPSITEGSPKVIPEAMTKGLPIVATRVGGIPELIEDGVNGILIEPRDPVGLANAIELLATNPIMRRTMGKASVDKAEAFCLEVQMERFADFIKDAYHNHRKDPESGQRRCQ